MASHSPQLRQAVQLMERFAERTGIEREGAGQRYLWTDAFAVCNLLGIARATSDGRYQDLALRLVDRVHHALGRYRSDDSRRGWLSGLDEEAGAAHPTRGGLRIGKKLPERRPDEPLDDRLEWDRDGQYLHYLTKWMHALDQVARFTKEIRFNVWARELAEVAFRAFSHSPRAAGRPRLRWKMSIDLSRPLVASMGQHDALDGYVTCAQLRATAARMNAGESGPDPREALEGFASMVQGALLVTSDPLGMGGLLMDACRVEQLSRQAGFAGDPLLRNLLEAALEGLRDPVDSVDVTLSASTRLAFRELGLSIGLHGVELLETTTSRAGPRQGPTASPTDRSPGGDWRAILGSFAPYLRLGERIESFWLDPHNRETPAWDAHRDINEVMLATSLLPEGCLVLAPL